MARYYLHAAVTVSAFTYVEAESLEEAFRIGEDRDEVVLGGIGSGAEPDEQWVIDDADGSPTGIHGEEA